MSLWKRIQRVGKKAAKFQFTASLEELSVSCCKGYLPKAVVVVLTRRGRRCTSKAIALTKSMTEENTFATSWSVPENLEFVTTLYRNEKDIVFEEKEWTFQVEDVGMSAEAFQQTPITATTRRRVLATRQLNVSEFASSLPTQNNLKIFLRLASKKVTSVVLILTLHGLMLRTGEATDEDMISIASMMSLSRASSFGAGSHLDVFGQPSASLSLNGPNSPSLNAAATARYHADLSSLTAKLQGLQRCQDFRTSTVEEEDEEAEAEGKEARLLVGQNEAAKETDSRKPLSQATSETTTDGPFSVPAASAEHQSPAAVSSKKDPAAKPDVPASKTEQDLLAWCQEVTRGYTNVCINDFTTSFRSGLAFCAILHHFVPELINFDALDVKNERDNVRLAFDTAAKLGIPRMLDPLEVAPPDRDRPPDRLGIMTYLHQLRMHFTKPSAAAAAAAAAGSAAAVGSSSPAGKPSAPLLSTPGASSPSPQSTAANASTNDEPATPQKSPSAKKTNTRRPLSDARASERYDQLVAKAKTLLRESCASPDKASVSESPTDSSSLPPPTPTENRISEDPSSNSIGVFDSSSFDQADQAGENVTPPSSVKIRRLKLSNLKLFSDGLEPHRRSSSRGRSTYTNGVSDHDRNNQDSFASCLSLGSYPSLMAEKAAIAQQQELLDREAPALEKKLREVMSRGGGDGTEEENLMRRWFSLVNQRNALVHRSYQLSIIEKEKDLQVTSEPLKQELHELLSKEDHLKSEEEKQRENTLLNAIVSMVNERNEIIQVLDHQEREFVEDVERGFRTDQLAQQTFHGSERYCSIQ